MSEPNAPRILAIETSGRSGSVAVAIGPRVLGERTLSADRRHAAELLPAIRDLCREAGWAVGSVEALCFSQGPGSFTGLRVAATAARMFQWSTGCQVVAVPTLEVIAANAIAATAAQSTQRGEAIERPMRVAVIMNAGRGRVFGEFYESASDERPRELEPVAVREPAKWIPTIQPPFVVAGEAVEEHRAVCERAGALLIDDGWSAAAPGRVHPTAAGVARLGCAMLLEGRVCRPQDIRPLYVRRPEAEEVYEQRRAEARARRGE